MPSVISLLLPLSLVLRNAEYYGGLDATYFSICKQEAEIWLSEAFTPPQPEQVDIFAMAAKLARGKLLIKLAATAS